MYDERREILQDYLSLRAGTPPTDDYHPTARQWAADAIRLAEVCTRAGLISVPDGDHMLRAVTHSDFPFLLETAMATTLNSGVRPSFLGFRDVCQTVDTPDYKGVEIFTAAQGIVSAVPAGGAPYAAPLPDLSQYETGAVNRYVIAVNISRGLVVNDSLTAVASILRASQVALYRTEAKAFAQALETNAALTDGAAWFGTSNSTTGGLDVGGLEAAMNLLTAQEVVSGTPSGALPYAVVVPPEMYFAGVVLAETLGNRIRMICCPYLTVADTYYMFADPAEEGALCRLRFDGQDAPQVETQCH